MSEQIINLNPQMKVITDHFRTGHIPIGNDNALVVEIDSHDRDTVNTWMDFSENIRREWKDVTKPLFIVVDMSATDFSFGAYANRRAANMMSIQPQIPTYIAWVIRESMVGNLMRASLNAFNLSSRAARFMVVYNRQDAYDWLLKSYTKDQSPG